MFVLLKLLVSDCDNLRVKNHLVHSFHIIKVVVKLLLSFREKSFSFVLLGNLEFVWLHLSSSLGIQLLHLSFSHLGLLLSSDLLLFKEFLFSDCLFFSFNWCCHLDSIQIILSNNHSIVLAIFLSFSSNCSQIVHRDDSGISPNTRSSSWWLLLSSEESLIDVWVFGNSSARSLTRSWTHLWLNKHQ